MIDTGYRYEHPQSPCRVTIPDLSDAEINDMLDFIEDTNINLVSFRNTDVSDSSYRWDTVAEFLFATPEDTIIFKLRFKCK